MRMQSWRLVMLSALAALLALYSTWWLGMINDPNERTATDFLSFYAAGRIAQTQEISSIYKINLQQDVEQNTLGVPLSEGRVLLFIHPPQFIPILSLLVDENFRSSLIRWSLLLLITYIATTIFLVFSLFTKSELITKVIIAGSILTFFALFISLWQGQDTAFLFLGVALWYVGILQKRSLFIIVGLALIAIRPHIWIALAIPLLFKYRKFEWLTGTVLISIFSLFLLRREGINDYINLLLISSKGQWFGLKQDVMLNLLGLIVRAFHLLDANTISIVEWLIFALGILVITVVWLRSLNIDHRVLGLTVILTIVTAPHLYLHDLTLLIFPLLFIIQKENTLMERVQPALTIIGTSTLLLLGILIPNTYFLLPYLVYTALIWQLFKANAISLSLVKST